jgi:hypothetical protein
MPKTSYSDDPWHYPRIELARELHKLLSTKLTNAVVLASPRRTGKTQFLSYDLAPTLRDRGHRVVMANFWEQRSDPIGVLVRALEAAAPKPTKLQAIRRVAAQALGEAGAKIKTPIFEAELKTARGGQEVKALSAVVYVRKLLEELHDPKRPTFLLLDEVQELAEHAVDQEFVAALRTGMDALKSGLSVVFTGSSVDGLRLMFDDATAPFFRFAMQMPFPPLDAGFVDHLLARFRLATTRTLDRDAARAAFDAFNADPLIFREMLVLMMQAPELDFAAAAARKRAEMASSPHYETLWRELSALDRAVIDHLLVSSSGLYARDTLAAFGAREGRDGPTPQSSVQRSVERLSGLGLIGRARRGAVVTDQAFRAWRVAAPN